MGRGDKGGLHVGKATGQGTNAFICFSFLYPTQPTYPQIMSFCLLNLYQLWPSSFTLCPAASVQASAAGYEGTWSSLSLP